MVKTYKLVPSKTFLKDLKKITSESKSMIDNALLELIQDPFSARDLKKLTNVKFGRWRLRIGDYRLRYDIVGEEIRLRIIRHRKDVYRKK